VEAKGVALMDGPEDAAVAAGKAEPLKTEEAELAWELVEATLGISPGDEPLSSAGGWVGSGAPADADEEVNKEEAAGFWQRGAGSFASMASVPTAGSCGRLSRSRSARPWTSVLSLGALGKNCAKLTPGGGRVIVSTSSCYLESRGVLMIPRSGSGQACHASLPPRLGRRASLLWYALGRPRDLRKQRSAAKLRRWMGERAPSRRAGRRGKRPGWWERRRWRPRRNG
jgi:hypothetical protein